MHLHARESDAWSDSTRGITPRLLRAAPAGPIGGRHRARDAPARTDWLLPDLPRHAADHFCVAGLSAADFARTGGRRAPTATGSGLSDRLRHSRRRALLIAGSQAAPVVDPACTANRSRRRPDPCDGERAGVREPLCTMWFSPRPVTATRLGHLRCLLRAAASARTRRWIDRRRCPRATTKPRVHRRI